MPSLRSSVLIIGHPNPKSVSFGADFAEDFDKARIAFADFAYPVVALPSSAALSKSAAELLEFVSGASPLSQGVIVQNDTPAGELLTLINSGSVFRILGAFDDPGFELTIQQALEEHSQLQQNAKLLQLVNEQNETLKRFTSVLEERVESRKNSIEDAKNRLLVTNGRVEALHRALVAIHQAGSIAEMERLINDALSGALGLTMTRVLFHSQSRMETANGLDRGIFASHSAPLTRGKELLGHIYFARPVDKPFSKDETAFLGQVGDAVSLAIDRLSKLEQSEAMKGQWEATFDAILEPVSLIASDFTLVRTNRAYADRSGESPESIIGRKCYEVLFKRTSPCEGCALADRNEKPSEAGFRLRPARTANGTNVIYDVYAQRIEKQLSSRRDEAEVYVNLYHDVSEQLRLERQILESAKMVELGTIGSSIAHELNNPLGGMLSFIQLIKMDLKGGEPYFDDIDEMEKGARRCRDIVQNLLGFTRKSSNDSGSLLDLREVLEQALKITELQTRAMGINLVVDMPAGEQPIEVRGEFNSLAQAIRNFLQNAQEAINERIKKGVKTPGEIRLRIPAVQHDQIQIEITDNGLGFDEPEQDQIFEPTYTTKDAHIHPGLGLTVARQIVRDHGGSLEIRSTKGGGTTAIISLPRPVFDP
ncbi:MAG: ATP-binding protein [Bdellovibrionota bacterium]